MVLWSKHQEQFEELNDAIQNVIRLARDGDELPEVTPADLPRAIKSIKKDTALGPDHLSPKELRRLPNEGVEALLHLYRQMEKGICVPEVFKQALVALLGKPGGGERPIALMPMLYRVWMRLRKNLVTGWDDKKHEFWDTAVKGSSPLQATYRRLCMDEMAVLQKSSVASCLWDMAKFYDSIDWRVLAVQAPKHGYPIRIWP